MRQHTESIDRTILEAQGKAINLVIEEIDDILTILQEQQEAIKMLEHCVVTLQRIILNDRES